MIFTSQIDMSYTKIFKATEPITALAAVALTDGGIKICAEDEIPFGIALNDAESGEGVSIQIRGAGLWKAGEEFNCGDLLAVGDDGAAIAADSGKFIFAQAITRGTVDSAAEVLIIRAGYAKAST